MHMTPQRFVHVGFGNMLCANRIEAMLLPGSAGARRLQKAAKEKNRYLDMTFGRAARSLLLLDNGKLVGCALSSKTIVSRIHATPDGMEEEKDALGETDTRQSVSRNRKESKI